MIIHPKRLFLQPFMTFDILFTISFYQLSFASVKHLKQTFRSHLLTKKLVVKKGQLYIVYSLKSRNLFIVC